MQHIWNLFKNLRWWGIVRTLALSKQFIQTFSGIFRDIQQYSVMFSDIEWHKGITRHIQTLLRHIELYSIILSHIQNSVQSYSELDTFWTPGTEKKPLEIDDWAYSEPWHSQKSLFKHFQEYLAIFRDIDAYSAPLTGVQLGGRGGLPCHFFENW